MKKSILLYLLLVGYSVSLYSQQKILFSKKSTDSYLLKYQNSDQPSQKNLNNLFQKIATTKNTNVYTLQKTFSVNKHILITRKLNNVKIEINYTDFKVDKLLYRKFDISETLLPATLSFTAVLRNKMGNKLKTFNSKNTWVDPENTSFTFTYKDSLPAQSYKLKVTQTQFIYTYDNLVTLDKKFKIVDGYYDFSNRMREGLSGLAAYNPRNLELIWTYQKMVNTNDALIDEIETSKVITLLKLENNDPEFFVEKFTDLKTLNTQVSASVENTIANLHEIYYNRGLEFFVNGDLIAAQNLFDASLKANPAFSPALYQLAKIDYLTGQLHDASIKLLSLFTRQRPDPNTYKLALDLSEQVVDAFMEVADTLIQRADYTSALAEIEDAEDFCYQIRDFDCRSIIFSYKQQAHSGIYYQQLSLARYNLSQGNTELAENYTRKAITYYRSYSDFVSNNDSAVVIMQEIKTKQYKALVNKGLTQLASKSYRSALASFEDAVTMETSFDLKHIPTLDLYLKQAAKPVILLDLDDISELIMGNDLVKAKSNLLSAINKSKKYDLTTDTEISGMLGQVKTAFFKQACANAKIEVRDYITLANNSMLARDFIAADENFEKAIVLSRDNPDCEIDVSEAQASKLEITPAVTYQQGIANVLTAISNNKFDAAVKLYLLAGQQFEREKVSEFDLLHPGLFEFVKDKKSTFIAFMSSYFTGKEEYSMALELLEILNTRELNRKIVKDEQAGLGAALAIRDHKLQPEASSKSKVLDYTKGNKWYKYLKKSYTKTWKKL